MNYKKCIFNAQGVPYSGLLLTSAADGVGVFYHADMCHKYFGEFRNDRLHGAGVHDYSTGNRYLGEFNGGERSGVGVYTFASGSCYWGDYHQDKRCGFGFYRWPNGTGFWGQFKNDMPDGAAVYEDPTTCVKAFERWINGSKVSEVPFDGSNEKHTSTLRQAQNAKVTYTPWPVGAHAHVSV